MKRSLIVLCAAALLATLPLASIAEAGRRGRPGWSNRTTKGGSYRRANPARRGSQGWQGWRGYRGWRDCQDTQPEEVMVEILHVIYVLDLGTSVFVFGRVIEVPESEVEEHEAHGDDFASVNFTFMSELTRTGWEVALGIDLGDANAILEY